MEDRELLEMAAKAAGVAPVLSFDGRSLVIGPRSNIRKWCPLDNDGQALRIAMQLGICIQFIPGCDTVQVYQEREYTAEAFNVHVGALGDIETRRCIVQAAAEIGKKMP